MEGDGGRLEGDGGGMSLEAGVVRSVYRLFKGVLELIERLREMEDDRVTRREFSSRDKCL